jgi:hypothetical protein
MCPFQYMFSFCEKYHILLTVEIIKRMSSGKQYSFQMGAVQVSVLSLVQSEVCVFYALITNNIVTRVH